MNCQRKWARVKDKQRAFSRERASLGMSRRKREGEQQRRARDSHFSITRDNDEWNSAKITRTMVFMNARERESARKERNEQVTAILTLLGRVTYIAPREIGYFTPRFLCLAKPRPRMSGLQCVSSRARLASSGQYTVK